MRHKTLKDKANLARMHGGIQEKYYDGILNSLNRLWQWENH